MFTNGLNMSLPQRGWVEKTVHGVERQWLSCKEIVSGTAANKEGHTNIVLRHEMTHHFLSSWQRYYCKQHFYLSTPWAKFNLYIWELFNVYINGDFRAFGLNILTQIIVNTSLNSLGFIPLIYFHSGFW